MEEISAKPVIISLCAVVVLAILAAVFSIESNAATINPSVTQMLFSFQLLLNLATLVSLILTAILHYRLWQVLPSTYVKGTSPVKAVGFLFIPVFNTFFWNFICYQRLAKGLYRFIKNHEHNGDIYHSVDTDTVNYAPLGFIVACLLFLNLFAFWKTLAVIVLISKNIALGFFYYQMTEYANEVLYIRDSLSKEQSNKKNYIMINWASLDPAACSGIQLPRLSFYNTYAIDRNKINLQKFCHELYTIIFEKIKSGSLENVSLDSVTYQFTVDASERPYLILRRSLMRWNAKATIFIRFLPYGDNLYVGLSSFVLGTLDFHRLIRKAWFSLVTIAPITFAAMLSLAFVSVIPVIGLALAQIILAVVVLIIASILSMICPQLSWLVIRGYNLKESLQQTFMRGLDLDIFNTDDAEMFMISTLNLVADTIKASFEAEGLPVDALENFVVNISQNFQGAVGVVAGNVSGTIVTGDPSQKN